ncbi:MAG TPA: methylated-DNA--[protein]-cysteine S-methyltransferase [Bryobacteraceae bacterium]
MRLFLERVETPTGTMLLATDGQDNVRALDWEDHIQRMQRLLRLHYGQEQLQLEPRSDASDARHALERYFDGELAAIDKLRVESGGTPFQREVWKALREIPAGGVTTYGRLAAMLGRPKAVRAVGLANGANPIGIVVPCHRVIGAGGGLTGYGGGLARKRWLLDHEASNSGVRFQAHLVGQCFLNT